VLKLRSYSKSGPRSTLARLSCRCTGVGLMYSVRVQPLTDALFHLLDTANLSVASIDSIRSVSARACFSSKSTTHGSVGYGRVTCSRVADVRRSAGRACRRRGRAPTPTVERRPSVAARPARGPRRTTRSRRSRPARCAATCTTAWRATTESRTTPATSQRCIADSASSTRKKR